MLKPFTAMYVFFLHTFLIFQLQFNNGDVIKVTKIVEGGWREGSCDGSFGWFPSAFIKEIEGMCECVCV